MMLRSFTTALQERLTSRMSRMGQSGTLVPEHCAIVLASSLSSFLRSAILERISSRWCAISRASAHDAFPGAAREQGADVFETETKLPAAPDEGEQASLGWSIDATASFGTSGGARSIFIFS
jgi:hypothetical protein